MGSYSPRLIWTSFPCDPELFWIAEKLKALSHVLSVTKGHDICHVYSRQKNTCPLPWTGAGKIELFLEKLVDFTLDRQHIILAEGAAADHFRHGCVGHGERLLILRKIWGHNS